MNLHAIVSGAIGTINPQIPVTIRVSTGATEDASGRSVPTYAVPIIVNGQRQDLSGSDIYRMQGQNIQGVICKLYLTGNFEGLFRVMGKGGDLLSFGGQVYLVAKVIERWPDWCSLALTMQLDVLSI